MLCRPQPTTHISLHIFRSHLTIIRYYMASTVETESLNNMKTENVEEIQLPAALTATCAILCRYVRVVGYLREDLSYLRS
jgi:hypothetical protein